ncbi:GNAT family N-acetyltransferase [Micromonospora sp. WMMB235]|uniref:GNAT family N-acetyltransferase n=1 Tax=Micromonospora sp. WMMB235 TaxID=1172030 RepID=UPI00115FA176|nr:GNAT family N-acetyltransferase [Micromonospora sp. WMMB235]
MRTIEHVVVSAIFKDIPSLAEMARRELPEMTLIHEPESWRTHWRFGVGETARDNLLIVARETEESPIMGFCWVDAAMYHDHGIEEPWWCLNALAVVPEYRRSGIGRSLVNVVKRQAEKVDISSIYGVCYPSTVDFWSSQGFSVTARGGSLEADRLVRLKDQKVRLGPLSDGEGDCMFVRSNEGCAPDAARLRVRIN